jgi:outer membrane protein TolC
VVLVVGAMAAPSSAGAQTPLTLQDAMARARTATPEARAATAAIAEADARVRQSRSGFYPRVDLSAAVQRGNQPVFVFSSLLSQRRFTAANFAIAALNDPDALTNTRTAIAIAQPIFDAGMTRLAVQGAALGRDLAVADRDRAAQDLAVRAARAYVRVLEIEASVRASEAAVAAADSDLERARARRDAGVVPEADVLAMDVHRADMRQRQITAAGELTIARLQLAEAVGLPLTDAVVLVPPTVPPPSPVEPLVAGAREARVEWRQAALHVQLADHAVRTARAYYLPTAGVQGGWEFNGSTLGNQQSSWVVGAEVRVNLFRGFADVARATEARHAQTRAAAERDRVARAIEVDIRSAVTRLDAARAREDAGRAALAQARESQRIIRDRYENGLATATDLLRAAQASLDAESRATSAAMDVILQAVALDRALGKL